MKVMALKPTIAPDDTDAIYAAFTRRAVTAHASKRSYCYTSMISNTLENIGFIFWYASTFDTIHRYNAFTVYSGFRIQQ